MYVVVTGAFGFLGSYVVKQCVDFGFTPLVLERKESRKEKLEGQDFISIPYASLDEPELTAAIRKYEPVSFVHIAWKGVDGSTRNFEEQVTYNLPFTLQTVELAHRTGCGQWVGIGSLSEYGKTTAKVDETFTPSPYTIYGKAKLASCWASSALCQSYNIKANWIRVGSIYGPGDADHWLIPYVMRSLMEGKSPELTPSKQVWDYLYVSDAANAVLSIVKSGTEGIFNLGSGKGMRIKDFIDIITERMKTDTRPQFGAKPYSVNQVMHMEADISKITSKTGWTPVVSFTEGIDRTLISIKNKL